MICFQVEGIPPSYNKHFNINYGLRQVYLSPEAKTFKNRVKMQVPPADFSTASHYRIEIEYHHNFKYKNGKNRRIDMQNMDKLLIDAIFEKLGVDDSYLYEMQQKKVQDDNSYTVVNIDEV